MALKRPFITRFPPDRIAPIASRTYSSDGIVSRWTTLATKEGAASSGTEKPAGTLPPW